jgi:hypothetical protein
MSGQADERTEPGGRSSSTRRAGRTARRRPSCRVRVAAARSLPVGSGPGPRESTTHPSTREEDALITPIDPLAFREFVEHTDEPIDDHEAGCDDGHDGTGNVPHVHRARASQAIQKPCRRRFLGKEDEGVGDEFGVGPVVVQIGLRPRGAPSWPRLQPTPRKACPTQPGQYRRATARDVPEQTRAVILDHQHHRTLIDAEVIRGDPPGGRTLVHRKRLIERRLEPVFGGHA